MKILHVIHGYPPYYMAGSEVYTYNLTRELSKYDDISVFTRVENPFEKPYYTFEEINEGIRIRRVNKPQRDYILQDKYLDEKIDTAFLKYAEEIQPDVVHIGHLSHLSTNIVNIAKEELGLPIIYTIHDFWLFCFRGQLVDTSSNMCLSQGYENCLRCAKHLFKDYVGEKDVRNYREHMERVVSNVDVFLSPSKFMKKFFENKGLPPQKVVYSKYGFNREKIRFREKKFHKNSAINFGFLGRIIPVKGVKILLEAFGGIENDSAKLLIFGGTGPLTKYLASYANKNVVFKGGYKNWEIDHVLDQIDVLVVPSLWYENSPLVIQEAFLADVPVITSNIGGMAELVDEGVDGYTFEVGNKEALRDLMKKIVKDPPVLNELKPNRDKVRSIEEDASSVRSLYQEVLKR